MLWVQEKPLNTRSQVQKVSFYLNISREKQEREKEEKVLKRETEENVLKKRNRDISREKHERQELEEDNDFEGLLSRR